MLAQGTVLSRPSWTLTDGEQGACPKPWAPSRPALPEPWSRPASASASVMPARIHGPRNHNVHRLLEGFQRWKAMETPGRGLMETPQPHSNQLCMAVHVWEQ